LAACICGCVLVAGLCAGLSILAKISGLYFVAAALLFLVPASSEERPEGGPGRPRVFVGLLALLSVLLVALVWRLISRRADWMELLHFIAPTAALGWTLVVREARQRGGVDL